ncbi:hypothetical protein [Candidatus Regiella insecticola]|uniref:hypothetical protein n=1 Tax=Candidatus Regiella insecticola TaxID=138073 RepID=UPI0005875152|nr:hypothetical protein [Candidatus Regiella insecticola]
MSIIHFGYSPMPNYFSYSDAVDSVTMDSMNHVAHLEEQKNAYNKKIFTPYFSVLQSRKGKKQ